MTTVHLAFHVGSPSSTINATETFWSGVWLYQSLAPALCDAGATHYSYVRKGAASNTSYTFDVDFHIPFLTPPQITALLTPLYTSLNCLGIPVNLTTIPPATLPAAGTRPPKTGAGAAPGNVYFASRLFPRSNWADQAVYNATFAAIRATVEEGGFTFHGVNFWTPRAVAGWPGTRNSIAAHWRGAIMHADVFDDGFRALGVGRQTPEQFWERHGRLERVMKRVREVTPDGGAYFNEADVLEPEWQRAFFGEGYGRLVGVKRRRDPWGVFWAVNTPGSERWAVEEGRGLPTQDGRLCLAGVDEEIVKSKCGEGIWSLR